MKMKFLSVLLAAVAITTGSTSCNNDGKADGMSAEGNQVLTIKLPSNVTTRGVEDPVATNSVAAVSDVTVFLLNGNSVVTTDTFTSAEIGAKSKRIEQVSSSVNRVILVANKGAAAIDSLTNADTIKKFAFTVASQNATAGIADKTMMGEAIPATTTDPDAGHDPTHTYKEVNVTLNALTARIEIGTVKPGTGIVNIELVNVWVGNYYADGSKLLEKLHGEGDPVWVTSPVTSTAASSAFGTITTPSYSEASYKDDASAQVTVGGNKVYAYQVFAGNIPHMIMLVKGEYATGYHNGTDKYFLGYVTYTNYNNGTSYITAMDANRIYKMGDVSINAKDITIKPEPEGIDLGITVTVTPWTEMNVTPEI